MSSNPAKPSLFRAMDADEQRDLAKSLYGRVWMLLETDGRTPEQDDEMIHAAHASRFHWGEVGGPEHRARGEWQCSRVYSVLGRGEPAIHHATRCLQICEQHGMGDWDLAFAYEALARAHGTAGSEDECARYKQLAREAGDEIADAEDREVFETDFATL
jgi:hypothetical protein